MSDTGNQHNERSTGTQGELPVAALLRMAADGELTAQQERRLEAELDAAPDAGAAARIECEQALRTALARAMNAGPSAPAELHGRVAEAMSALLLDGAVDAGRPGETLPETLAPATRDRSFWSGGSIVRLGALAAALAIGVTGALMMLQAGRSADGAFASRTAAAQFVAKEHGRCVVDIEPGAGKFKVHSTEQLPGFAQEVIGREVAIADLIASGAENVAFIDAGPCGVPRGGKSMHVRFDVPLGSGESTRVSLFVQQYTGEQALDPGTTYELDAAAGADDQLKSPTIYTWLRDGLVYYLVIDRSDACDSVRARMDAPETIRPLAGAA